ncbi:arginine N-succinyltransferase [Phycisphaerales bacterium AB-hyl4]|uniref:Arginine N-succinyltransferase n=1 Tax=Natronomicrosphaera hydrolytica TaxID=3242702 RepID=A0ABV4U0W6_9BACT
MLLIRPVILEDVDDLVTLAHHTGFGLTTLPRDRAMLERRVRDSLRGFEKLESDPPRGESYLFVMEDLSTHKIVGTSGMVSKVGGFEPFYAYRIETSVHESQTLGVRKEIPTLHLLLDHDGPCEIGSLFLHPDHRRHGNGRALSLVRFLFMADHASLFDPVVIAEMRGVIDRAGGSAFWDAVGKHFFDLDFPKADYLSIVNKQFIGDLMPKHPIYIPLLPPEAQAVIGQVHDETRPAKRILELEGFQFSGMVDIFEAGPVLRCERDAIRTVRDSQLTQVRDITDDAVEGPMHLISNTRRAFRACHTAYATNGQGLVLRREIAEALEVEPGDSVRHLPLHAPEPTGAA